MKSTIDAKSAETASPGMPGIVFTDAAARKVQELILEERNPELKLRVYISGGGCSGFQYGFSFDDAVNPDDRVFEKGGVTAVIDEASLDILDGSTIDYVEDLIGSAFRISNSSFTASCGCGASFAI